MCFLCFLFFELEDAKKIVAACRFTHFDTAEDYNNQIGVGKELAALFASGVKRSDVFITTKTGTGWWRWCDGDDGGDGEGDGDDA